MAPGPDLACLGYAPGADVKQTQTQQLKALHTLVTSVKSPSLPLLAWLGSVGQLLEAQPGLERFA